MAKFFNLTWLTNCHFSFSLNVLDVGFITIGAGWNFLQYIKGEPELGKTQLSWRVCECGDWKGQVEIKNNYTEQIVQAK